MPTVPTLSGQQVAPQPLGDNAMLGVRYAPEVFGSGIAEGAAHVGAAVQDIWETAQKQANETKTNDGVAQVDALGNALQNKFQGLHGEQANSGLEGVHNRFDEGVQQIRDGLTNDAQRRDFDAYVQRRRGALGAATSAHALQESEVQAADNYQAVKQNAGNRAALNANDPTQVAQAWADVDHASDVWAGHRGFTKDQRSALRSSDAGSFYGGVIRQQLNAGNDQAAQALFDAHQGEMDGANRSVLVAPLANGRLLGAGKRAAAQVYADGKPLGQMVGEIAAMEGVDPQAKQFAQRQVANLADLYAQKVMYEQGKAAADAWQTAQTDPRGIWVLSPQQFAAMGQENAQHLQMYFGISPQDSRLAPLDPHPSAGRPAGTSANTPTPADDPAPKPPPLSQQEEAEQSKMRLRDYFVGLLGLDPKLRNQALHHGPDLMLLADDRGAAIQRWQQGLAAAQGDALAQSDLRRLGDKQRAIDEVLTAAGHRFDADPHTGLYDQRTASMLARIERDGQARQDGLPGRRQLTSDEWSTVAAQALARSAVFQGPWSSGGGSDLRDYQQLLPYRGPQDDEPSANADGDPGIVLHADQQWEP